MAESRNALAIVMGSVLLSGCFIAGFLLVWQGAVTPVPVPATPIETGSPVAASIAASSQGLVIKKAVYGELPDGASADVTKKVAERAGKMDLEIEANNENFGDPSVGANKKLRVDYLANGVLRSRTVPEGETLRIHVKSGPARLVVKKAVYGDFSNNAVTDVTEKVAQAAEDDLLTVAASNDNFGDPAFGIAKKLRVDYTWDGKERTRTVEEYDTLSIAGDDGN